MAGIHPGHAWKSTGRKIRECPNSNGFVPTVTVALLAINFNIKFIITKLVFYLFIL